MKIIFLDIDGVLNSDDFFEGTANSDLQGIEREIDVEKIKLLKKAIDETGAKIVLSSSWRYMKKVQDLKELLSQYGISITGSTSFIEGKRGLEINQWLIEHPDVVDFVILDDEIFDSYDEKLLKKLLKMSDGVDSDGYSFGEGLLPKDIDEIIKRLGKKKEENETQWTEESTNDYLDNEISKRRNKIEYYRVLHHDSDVIHDVEYIRDDNKQLFSIEPILKSIPCEYISQEIINKIFLNHDIFNLAMELHYIPKELRTEELFVRYALLYPETLISRIHGEYYGNRYESYYEDNYGTNLLVTKKEFTIPVMVAHWLGTRRWVIEEFHLFGDYGYDLERNNARLAVEINSSDGLLEEDSLIAEKRKKATEIAWEIFCSQNYSEEWWLDFLYDYNKIDELFNLIMAYTQNQEIPPHKLVGKFNVDSLSIEADNILKSNVRFCSTLEKEEHK